MSFTSGQFIYGILNIPIDINSKICGTNVTDPSVYHCAAGERDVDNYCDPQNQYPISQWCFAKYTYGAYHNNNGCSCVPVTTTATTGSKPNPYNWMAGLVTVPAGTQGPSITIPAVNGSYPHNLPTGSNTGLSSTYVGFTDQTPIGLIGSNAGGAQLIVAYAASWFSSLNDVDTFIKAANWLNVGTDKSGQTEASSYSYGGVNIPDLYYQIYNYILLSGGTNNAGMCGQTSNNCVSGAGASCSLFNANDTLAPQYCGSAGGVIATLFGIQNKGLPPPQTDLLNSFESSSRTYCSNNNPNVDCGCINAASNPDFTAVYGSGSQIPGLDVTSPGCWWLPCRLPNSILPNIAGSNFYIPNLQTSTVCGLPVTCATIIQNVGGQIQNPGNINQYINCTQSGGGGGGGGGNNPIPNPPGTPTKVPTWVWLAIGFTIVIFIIIMVVIYVIKHSQREEEKQTPTTPTVKPQTATPIKPQPSTIPIKPQTTPTTTVQPHTTSVRPGTVVAKNAKPITTNPITPIPVKPGTVVAKNTITTARPVTTIGTIKPNIVPPLAPITNIRSVAANAKSISTN